MTWLQRQEQDDKIDVTVDVDLEELIPGFLDNRRKDSNDILQALIRGNYEKIRMIGHTLKGVGGGYGFDAITNIGFAVEQAAKAQNGVEIQRCVDELDDYLDNVHVLFQ